MNKYLNYYLAALLTLSLAACANAPRIESIQDSIAFGYLTLEGTADAALIAYESQVISVELKNAIAQDLRKAKEYLDTSKRLMITDLGASQDALGAAETILSALQIILMEAER